MKTAKFVIREYLDEVDFEFFTSNGKSLFHCKNLPDLEAAKSHIRKLKRRTGKDQIPIQILGGYYFQIRDKDDNLLCISHKYSRKQRAEDGRAIALREMRDAKVERIVHSEIYLNDEASEA